MSQPARKFQVLAEEELAEAPAPKTPDEASQRNMQLLLLSIRIVSQRFITAVSHLFTAAMVGSALLLWWRALPDPTPLQLVGLGMWAVFLLAVEFIRRTR
jgi:hypothetical protein